MDVAARLAQAKDAIKHHKRDEARLLLDQLVVDEPGCEEAWLLLAVLVAHKNEKVDCLTQALAINPHNQEARAKYEQLRPPVQPAPKKKKPKVAK
jgi:hypothetical protein